MTYVGRGESLVTPYTRGTVSLSLSHHMTWRASRVRPYNEAAAVNNGTFSSDSPMVNLVSNVAANAAMGTWKARRARYTKPNNQICSVGRAMPSANAAMDVLAINYGLPSKPAVTAFNKHISIDPNFSEGCSLASMVHLLKMAQQHMGFPAVEIDEDHDLLTAPAKFPWAGIPPYRHHCLDTGARVKAWCVLIHAEAFLSLTTV